MDLGAPTTHKPKCLRNVNCRMLQILPPFLQYPVYYGKSAAKQSFAFVYFSIITNKYSCQRMCPPDWIIFICFQAIWELRYLLKKQRNSHGLEFSFNYSEALKYVSKYNEDFCLACHLVSSRKKSSPSEKQPKPNRRLGGINENITNGNLNVPSWFSRYKTMIYYNNGSNFFL